MKQLFSKLFISILFISCAGQKGDYICSPCDLPCDTLSFNEAGVCPHCKMNLVEKSTLIDESTLVLNDIQIKTGSGIFLMEGAKDKPIKVYYHKPEKFTKEDKILMIIPGAGRNGDSYRDAWIEESNKYNVLILSPMYQEENYSFEDYHLCGLVSDLNINESVEFSENSNVAVLNEEVLSYKVVSNKAEWLFNDFDRIFDLVVNSMGGSQTMYDIFGHSAGGQILHRFSIFQDSTKANKIIAANAGFYTLPDVKTALPFGIKNSQISNKNLSNAFTKEMILLIGALDNENEKGGTLLRSKTVDQQGYHRLERAKYFFEFSKRKAEELQTMFNWKIEIVPNVGHSHELMGNAAAKILYE